MKHAMPDWAMGEEGGGDVDKEFALLIGSAAGPMAAFGGYIGYEMFRPETEADLTTAFDDSLLEAYYEGRAAGLSEESIFTELIEAVEEVGEVVGEVVLDMVEIAAIL